MTTTNKFAAFTNKFEEIRQKLEQQKKSQDEGKTKGSFDNSWKFQPSLPKDKPKIAFKIRILPNVHNTEAAYPWISAPFHMFRNSGGKFVYTLCPSLNDNKEKGVKNKCPICEKSSALFKTLDSADEKVAHEMWRKQRFFVNVLIVEDPRPAEQNQKGQVLVYEYGKKVQEKVEDAMLEQKIDIINPLAGHDLLLIIKKQGEHTNYDSSTFSIEKTPIATSEEEMNRIFDAIHNLNEKILGRGPQTYEKLTSMLNSTAAPAQKKDEVDTSESVEVDAEPVKPVAKSTTAAAPKATAKADKPAAGAKDAKAGDDEFDFNFEE